ncbi:hypothetical protein CYMTET_11377 [Cymbomonas tetramitiformis]|uniref:Uncharacterized protein n=1 Tax=Cymbomonas tetramitiformis TaxID=36881 RepID=A0AAE0GMK5_9CHLO|nr:hypothetical protein CYMTET_11377 [Cymbomonas tetramitiformis]
MWLAYCTPAVVLATEKLEEDFKQRKVVKLANAEERRIVKVEALTNGRMTVQKARDAHGKREEDKRVLINLFKEVERLGGKNIEDDDRMGKKLANSIILGDCPPGLHLMLVPTNHVIDAVVMAQPCWTHNPQIDLDLEAYLYILYIYRNPENSIQTLYISKIIMHSVVVVVCS